MDREVMHLRDSLIPRYAEMVYYGYWFSPEREMLQTAIDDAQRPVSGMARLKLYKGNAAPSPAASRRTPSSTPTSPPSRPTPSTARRTPRASSASTRCD